MQAYGKVAVGISVFRIGIPLSHVPQSTVLGHCSASGLVSGLHIGESQVGSPGIPDKPFPTPHFVSHPLGSFFSQLPITVGVNNR